MIAVEEILSAVRLGDPARFRNLTIFPLMGMPDVGGEAGYLLLDDALARGVARVTEVGEEGLVPQLRFENQADVPVFLMDGEELVGAKQNRTLNLSILAPPKCVTVLPVSCVEAGRWRSDSPQSSSSKHMLFSNLRATKAAHVTRDMQAFGGRSSDQGAVWEELRSKASRMSTLSPTDAMSDIFERHSLAVEEFVRMFHWTERQVGVLFAINGKPLGADLFDRAETMRTMLPKLVRSFALDALDVEASSDVPAAPEAALLFLHHAGQSQTFARPALGLGEDIRFMSGPVQGAALAHWSRVVHLCAFASTASSSTVPPSRIGRPSSRRRT